MELKITKEKVLEAASKCETAKQTLKTLFPEVFTSGMDCSKLVGSSSSCDKLKTPDGLVLLSVNHTYPRAQGESLILWDCAPYKWEVERMDNGDILLIPSII